jgi:hypothetical protein
MSQPGCKRRGCVRSRAGDWILPYQIGMRSPIVYCRCVVRLRPNATVAKDGYVGWNRPALWMLDRPRSSSVSIV